MWLRRAQMLCCLAGLSLSLGVMCLYAQEGPDTVIKKKCAKDWPDDFRMQVHCIEQQAKGLKSLSSPVDRTISSQDHSLLRVKCENEWPDDFRMRAHCEEQQIKGLQKIQSPAPQDMDSKDFSVVMSHCTKEWPNDFRMRAYCLDKQIEAVRTLRGR